MPIIPRVVEFVIGVWSYTSDNEILTYTYDHEGDETLTAGSDSLVTTVWYNERGQLARLDRGNDVLTDYIYYGATENFRLQTADTWRSGSLPTGRLDLNYTYDDVGNILTIFDDVSDDSQSFTYDHRDRLLTAQATGGYANYTESYSYDKLGNLLNITRPRKPTTTVIQLAAATSPMRLIRLKSRLSHLQAK
jgi:YD repeat-containing protein